MMNPERRSPLEESSAIHKHARANGLEYVRDYRAIRVTDLAALKAAGYTIRKEKPDRARIAKAIDAGLAVPGAEMGGTEYVLRGRER